MGEREVASEPTVAVAGSGRSADTAVVLQPANTQTFFALRFLEVLCMPSPIARQERVIGSGWPLDAPACQRLPRPAATSNVFPEPGSRFFRFALGHAPVGH